MKTHEVQKMQYLFQNIHNKTSYLGFNDYNSVFEL